MKHVEVVVVFLAAGAMFPVGCENKNEGVAEMETSGVDAMIREVDMVLSGKGNHAEEWGYDIAYAIRTNADAVVRRKLANRYVKQLENTCPLDGVPSGWARRLYNYRHVLMSVDSLQDELDDAEAPFKLMLQCIHQYDDAIRRTRLSAASAATVSQPWHSSRANVVRELRDDFTVFANFLKNLYMPNVAKLRLPKDRYEFWIKKIGSAINIQNATGAVPALVPDMTKGVPGELPSEMKKDE